MYLVVDRGNTRLKLALFKQDELLDLSILDTVAPDAFESALDELELRHLQGSVSHGIYSSVTGSDDPFISILEKHMHALVMSSSCMLPIKNRYGTPSSLGHDRIAAAVAGKKEFPDNPVLTIDAGTCITYDLVNAEGEYLGGGISPGLALRFKALHTFTGKLPLVRLDEHVGLIGDSTDSSIRSGVFNGALAEIGGIIDRYRLEFPALKIILTGGDANYFDKRLKSDIFAVPNLVLIGLKDILRYNVEN